MLYDKNTGKTINGFTEISAKRILIETIGLGAGAFLVQQVLKIFSKSEALAFDKSLIEDLVLSLIACFIGLLISKFVLKAIAARKEESTNSI